jgi:hypothetical protein
MIHGLFEIISRTAEFRRKRLPMSRLLQSLPALGSRKNLKLLIGVVCLLFLASSAYSQTTECFTYDGTIQLWTVPDGVTSITMEAWGAQGGNSTWAGTVSGGLGAYMSGTFTVTPGDDLQILVGGQGESLAVGGGGGGSFVATIGDVPLLVAGGGGGASSDQAGVDAVTSQDGTADSLGGISGGTGGAGGSVCGINQNDGGGGGGFNSDGADATDGIGNGGFGGIAFVNGGTIVPGGRLDGACSNDPAGGFGGGGSATCNTVGGGGGGGYSGGAGGPHIGNCGGGQRAGGGGGGSYNIGTSQTNTPGVQSGNGEVCITYAASTGAGIPTLDEWTLILFGLLLGLAGILILRPRG